jgi:hypothetical protein
MPSSEWRTCRTLRVIETLAQHIQAARLHAYPLIDEIQPGIVIALGKKAKKILAIGGRPFRDLIVWNRSQALTEAALQERAAAAVEIRRRILGRPSG